VDRLDRGIDAVTQRLYREHTKAVGSNVQNLKDLNILNRKLDNVIIIDNVKECFAAHPDNGIEIASWTGVSLSVDDNVKDSVDSHGKKTPIPVSGFQNISEELYDNSPGVNVNGGPITDVTLINLAFWLEKLVSEGQSVPDFIRTNRANIEEAAKCAGVCILPDFQLGMLSTELFLEARQRCNFPFVGPIENLDKLSKSKCCSSCKVSTFQITISIEEIRKTPPKPPISTWSRLRKERRNALAVAQHTRRALSDKNCDTKLSGHPPVVAEPKPSMKFFPSNSKNCNFSKRHFLPVKSGGVAPTIVLLRRCHTAS